MLQQTQVERVVPFFTRFVKAFPTPVSLARAPLREVLAVWQGLGYNRRALLLKRAAEIILREHGGEVPCSTEKLDALPGLGPYTAGAILAFAFDQPAVFIETNIRTVFLHFFFKDKKKVNDKEILELVRQTLPSSNIPTNVGGSPREWYSALMDYGAHLKETVGNLNAEKSANYAKQPPFKGSRRELRGEILRRVARGPVKATDFTNVAHTNLSISAILYELVREGFLKKQRGEFILPS